MKISTLKTTYIVTLDKGCLDKDVLMTDLFCDTLIRDGFGIERIYGEPIDIGHSFQLITHNDDPIFYIESEIRYAIKAARNSHAVVWQRWYEGNGGDNNAN